jgi:lysophospholipase L1-like esterase
MKVLGSSRALELALFGVLGLVGSLGGCGSGSDSPSATSHTTTSSGKSSSGASSGSTGSGSGTLSNSSSGGDDTSLPTSSGGDDAGDDASGDAAGDDASGEAGAEAGSAAADATTTPPACVKGQVSPDQVIVIGDSYLDHPVWSNAIPDLYADLRASGDLGATATYREYQLGGAAMNYGTLNLNIPYQYETTAKGDVAVMNPKDIDTVIMDGGGNDVLIDNQECMTNADPPPTNAMCATAIQATVDRASKLLQEFAADGVKHVIYTFYPHLDPAGGGILPMPAPQVNATLDYAYPLAEQICCGSSFTSTPTSYTCTGNPSGVECVFVDLRPAFEGHIADYIKSDHVHPTDAGAQVIADLVAGAMSKYCIAQ